MRSVAFYRDALGLRLSDHSGEIIAFMHGAHGSDHHLLAFAKSDGPGLHHSSWDVATIDAVGVGMEQMAASGYTRRMGRGPPRIGSNYFRYIRDPWGSFAEYPHDIDYIPADVDGRPPIIRRRTRSTCGARRCPTTSSQSRNRGEGRQTRGRAKSATTTTRGGTMNIVRRAMIGAHRGSQASARRSRSSRPGRPSRSAARSR